MSEKKEAKKYQILCGDTDDTAMNPDYFECGFCQEVFPIGESRIICVEGGYDNASKKDNVVMQIALICDKCYKKGETGLHLD